MLCWWDEHFTKLSGMRFDKPWEQQQLKRSSLADPELIKDFSSVGVKASRKQILNMVRYQLIGKTLGIA